MCCSVYLIRGNHESAPVTVLYGFFAECIVKAGEETWQRVCNVRRISFCAAPRLMTHPSSPVSDVSVTAPGRRNLRQHKFRGLGARTADVMQYLAWQSVLMATIVGRRSTGARDGGAAVFARR